MMRFLKSLGGLPVWLQGAIGTLLATAISATFAYAVSPSFRHWLWAILTARIYLLWSALLAMFLLTVVIWLTVRLKQAEKKIIELELELKEVTAKLEAKDAEFKKHNAQRNAQHAATVELLLRSRQRWGFPINFRD